MELEENLFPAFSYITDSILLGRLLPLRDEVLSLTLRDYYAILPCQENTPVSVK